MKTVKLFLSLLILGVNSIGYSIYGAKYNYEGLWDFSGYIFYAVYILLLVSFFEKSNFRKKVFFSLCAALPFAGIIFGFRTQILEITNNEFFISLSLQSILFITSAIVLRIYTKKIMSDKETIEKIPQANEPLSCTTKNDHSNIKNMSPKQVAAFMQSGRATEEHKRLFFASVFVVLALFPLGFMIITATIIRNCTKSFDMVKDIFILSETAFIILNLIKFYIYKNQKIILIMLEFIIQIIAILTYFYLNANIYYQSSTHNLAIYMLPAVSILPFLLSSSKITKEYTALMQGERNDDNKSVNTKKSNDGE